MNLKRIFVIVLATALAASCLAQGGGGQGRRGGFGRGGYGPAMLLMRKDVQADLVITDDEKAKLDQIQTDTRSQMSEIFQSHQDDRQAAFKEMQPIMQKAGDSSLAVLTPDQRHRLDEISIQISGNMAVVNNKSLQDGLGLSDDQKTQIADLLKTEQAANQAVMEKVASGELQREDAGPARTKNRQAVKDGVDKILSDDQKAKLKGMTGKPFTSTEDNGGGGV